MGNGRPICGAVIVAGGSGRRMGGEVPKQFLPLGREGRPVLVHTVERFIEALPERSPVVVVVPAQETERWERIARQWRLWERVGTCEGGQSRAESVCMGLAAIECDLVAIHDGVRPLVGTGLITSLFAAAVEHGSAVPCVRPVDSFRAEDGHGGTVVCDRDALLAVQTPQVFAHGAIVEAYANIAGTFTDDAGVFEAAGRRIHICEGERHNIKVTTPLDMAVASALLDAGY